MEIVPGITVTAKARLNQKRFMKIHSCIKNGAHGRSGCLCRARYNKVSDVAEMLVQNCTRFKIAQIDWGNTSFPKGLATLTQLHKVRIGKSTVHDWGRPKNGQLWTKNGRLIKVPK